MISSGPALTHPVLKFPAALPAPQAGFSPWAAYVTPVAPGAKEKLEEELNLYIPARGDGDLIYERLFLPYKTALYPPPTHNGHGLSLLQLYKHGTGVGLLWTGQNYSIQASSLPLSISFSQIKLLISSQWKSFQSPAEINPAQSSPGPFPGLQLSGCPVFQFLKKKKVAIIS